METTYQLKPNVTWHDGIALHAEDFAFGWRVYSGRASSHAGAAPFRFIEGVQAPDAGTCVIRWWQLYPGCRFHWRAAARFPPLPRHVLEESFKPDQFDQFVVTLSGPANTWVSARTK